jgi:hypothetical protein
MKRSLILLVVGLILIIAPFAWMTADGQQRHGRYAAAPVCAPNAANPGMSEDCRLVGPATLTRVYSETTRTTRRGRTSTDVDLLADLRGPDDQARTVEIIERANWEQLRPGQPVTAELWNGKVVRLEAQGRSISTLSPDGSGLAFVVTIITVVGLGIVVFNAIALIVGLVQRARRAASAGTAA